MPEIKKYRNRNLGFGFGISFLILVGVSVFSLFSISALINSSQLVNHSRLVTQKLDSISSVMKDAETGQRGYLLSGDEVFLEPYHGVWPRVSALVDSFHQLSADDPIQTENEQKIKALVTYRYGLLEKSLLKKRRGLSPAVADLKAGKQAMDRLRDVIKTAVARENRQLQEHLILYHRLVQITPAVIGLAALLAFGISFYAYRKVTSELNERKKTQLLLEDNEIQLKDAIEELAAANEEMGSTNEELAATNDELSASQNSLQVLNLALEARVKERTHALEESERRFRGMIETIPQISWTLNAAGEVDFYNSRWYEYTGLDERQTWEAGWEKIIHPEDLAHTFTEFGRVLESKEPGEFEIRERRLDGQYRWHLVRLQPVLNGGELVQWIGTATDIEDLKALQQQKDDFINIASHELKTPITSLKGSLQMLDKLKDNPSERLFPKLVGMANKSLERITYLVEDLLNAGKLNQGNILLNETWFDLDEAIDAASQHIRQEGRFEIIQEGTGGLEAYADAERIGQVLVNFLNNVVKYAPESKRIRIATEIKEQEVCVSVSDSGPGIPKERLPYLFERYYKIDYSGAEYSGLGLGLYISSEIVKRHSGKIGVESKPGQGSTFWFRLPQGRKRAM